MKGKKTGGRKAGTCNAVTRDMRAAIRSIVENRAGEFEEMMSLLKPKEYCDVYLGLCRYVVPALQSVSLEAGGERERTVEELLAELSRPGEGGRINK